MGAGLGFQFRHLGSVLGLSPGRVTLGGSLNLSEPQFPNLADGEN